MPGAISAHGTLLKIGDGEASETFTTIAEVTSISGPALVTDAVDTTSHDSPSNHREFIGGLKDAGEVTFDINYIPTNPTHDATGGLLADYVARTLRNFQLVFSDSGNTTWSFTAIVTGFESNEPVDAQLTASVTLRITGAPTLA